MRNNPQLCVSFLVSLQFLKPKILILNFSQQYVRRPGRLGPLGKAKIMDFTQLDARINSFKQPINGFAWNLSEPKLTAESMGAAGLYFTPNKKYTDMVTCYSCSGKLCGFSPKDDPVADHKANYPSCLLSTAETPDQRLSASVENISLSASNLPPGWSEHKAASGQVYYVDETSGETSHEFPSSSLTAAVSSFGTSKALSKQKVPDSIVDACSSANVILHNSRRTHRWYMWHGQNLSQLLSPDCRISEPQLATRLSPASKSFTSDTTRGTRRRT